MKREITSLVIASAVVAGSAFSPVAIKASAASVQQKQTVVQEMVFVNGKAMNVHSVMWKGHKLHSVDDLAKVMSATKMYDKKSKSWIIAKGSGKSKKWITIKNNGMIFVNNKKSKTMAALAGKSFFMDASMFVTVFGGGLMADKNVLISQKGAITAKNFQVNVDGTLQTMKSLRVNGKYLYSVQDAAKAIGGTASVKGMNVILKKDTATVTMAAGSNVVMVNGKAMTLKEYPVIAKGVVYADLNTIVNALGGDMVKGDSGYVVMKMKLMGGDTFDPEVLNDRTVLVSNDEGDTEATYLLDSVTKKVIKKFEGTEFSISPDKKQAIYSDEKGFAHLVDLVMGTDKQLSADEDSIKTEYIWSKDGQKVYALQNDKADTIVQIDLTTGAATKVFGDGVPYKSDLHITADGQKLLYVVGKEAKTDTVDDGNGGTDVTGIHTEGTEPQVNVIDLTAETKTAAAVTKSADNKVFPGFLNDGTIVYVSAKADDDKALPVLNMIGKDNSETALLSGKDIISTQIFEQGSILVLTAEANGSAIYEINPDTKKVTQLVKTDLELTSFNWTMAGLAVTAPGMDGDKVLVYKNNGFTALTK
ncbi:stalk domain-containing protein [Metabacillus sp. RGM 3146]|uniref:stalk domain-containing protein n=1 Tax=Metabacillus sp. RGM 3146 TaxID=3401092 RepID=UPI003B9BEA57